MVIFGRRSRQRVSDLRQEHATKVLEWDEMLPAIAQGDRYHGVLFWVPKGV